MAKIERGIYVSISSGEIETAEVHDSKIKLEGAREFAEWLANNRKYNPMKHDIGFAWSDEAHFSTVDEVLAEWQKGAEE